jgi:hypothetical protein
MKRGRTKRLADMGAPTRGPTQSRGLGEILIEAANAIADAIEGRRGRYATDMTTTSSNQGGMSELEERSERIRLAYMERAAGDRRELEGWRKERKLTTEEISALAALSTGYRLMPDLRDKLGLTTPLNIPPERGAADPLGMVGSRAKRARPPTPRSSHARKEGQEPSTS